MFLAVFVEKKCQKAVYSISSVCVWKSTSVRKKNIYHHRYTQSMSFSRLFQYRNVISWIDLRALSYLTQNCRKFRTHCCLTIVNWLIRTWTVSSLGSTWPLLLCYLCPFHGDMMTVSGVMVSGRKFVSIVLRTTKAALSFDLSSIHILQCVIYHSLTAGRRLRRLFA